MYSLKGFISNAVFADNTPGAAAVIGELSTQSSTYSTTKGYYSQEAIPDLTFVSFLSQDSSTGTVAVPASIVTQVLQVAAWVYAQTQAVPNPGQIAADTLLAGLLNQFQTSAQNFTSGAMVTDGTYWVPEWLEWENTTDSTYGSIATGNPNLIKIWFTDGSFEVEYDEFSIVVVPPMTNLDGFFTTSSNVQALLAAQNYVDTMALVQAAKGNNPESIIEAQTYNYVDPALATNLIPTNWTVLIYGQAGNNIDAIANAIIAYILANSTHTQAEWTAILPDLFKRTEFTLIPMWDQYAIPNRNQVSGIYSPVASPSRALAMMTQVASSYPEGHINSNCCVQTYPYKSVALVSCGSPNNRNAEYQIENVFPDILSVPSQSLDFARMSTDTQNFMLLLGQMLPAAEALTEYGNVPTGMTKLTRNNILYLVASYEGINYLMVAKSNFPIANVAAFGGDGVYVPPSGS
jgi:hypothetical protein